MISNNKPLQNINQLLQLGLAPDLKKLAYYRIIMQDPRLAVYSMVYRDLTIGLLNTLINWVLNDSIMYNRARQLLMQDHKGRKKMSEAAFDNLVKKAEKNGVELTEVIELYNEGFEQDGPSHQTRERRAFDFVNATLANQKREAANKPKSAAFRALQEATKQTSDNNE